MVPDLFPALLETTKAPAAITTIAATIAITLLREPPALISAICILIYRYGGHLATLLEEILVSYLRKN